MKARAQRLLLWASALGLAPVVAGSLAHANPPDGALPVPPQEAAAAIREALGLDTPVAASPPRLPPARTELSSTTSAYARHVLWILGLADEAPSADEPAVAAAPAPGLAVDPAAAPAPVPAAGASGPHPPLALLGGHAVATLGPDTLDTVRGGFIGAGGLQISFGIERAVYLNGELVTTTGLNLSELGTLAAGKAAVTLPQAGSQVALIQSGAGNAVLSSLGPAAIGTIIQNTLDGQKIQTLTVINATVNSQSVLRSIELQRNVRSAITDALRR